MDDSKGLFGFWLFLIFAGFILFIPVAKAEIKPTAPATNPTPITSTVSYDSLRIMAYSGQSDQAIKLAQEYLKTHENSSIRILLARMLAWNKQFDAAREQLYFVLSKHPGNYDASDCLSDVEIWQGNYQRAFTVLANALKYDPGNEKLLEKQQIILAKMQISAGHRDQAIQIAETWLKSHDSPTMQIYLATQLGISGEYDKARTLLESILSKKPSDTDARNALANIEITTGNYAKPCK